MEIEVYIPVVVALIGFAGVALGYRRLKLGVEEVHDKVNSGYDDIKKDLRTAQIAFIVLLLGSMGLIYKTIRDAFAREKGKVDQ